MFTKRQKKKYDDEIALLKHELEDLRQVIKTQELIKLRAENARLKEKEQLINKVRFMLKDIGYLEEENAILVKYKIPDIKVYINEENKPEKNEMFYAINRLQLISLQDMKKISAIIDNIKNKK